jgi:hypothetical protein
MKAKVKTYFICNYCGKSFTTAKKCQIHEETCSKKDPTKVTTLYKIILSVPIVGWLTDNGSSMEYLVDEIPNVTLVDVDEETGYKTWVDKNGMYDKTIVTSDKINIGWDENDADKLCIYMWFIDNNDKTEDENVVELFKIQDKLIDFFKMYIKTMNGALTRFKKEIKANQTKFFEGKNNEN